MIMSKKKRVISEEKTKELQKDWLWRNDSSI